VHQYIWLDMTTGYFFFFFFFNLYCLPNMEHQDPVNLVDISHLSVIHFFFLSNQALETIISLGYILSHYSQHGLLDVCIVLGKWVCQTFIYGYIVTTYGCNSLKYIISQGGLYYFTFNIRLLVKFWMWSKI